MFISQKYPNRRFNSIAELEEFSKKREETLEKLRVLRSRMRERIKVLKMKKVFPL